MTLTLVRTCTSLRFSNLAMAVSSQENADNTGQLICALLEDDWWSTTRALPETCEYGKDRRSRTSPSTFPRPFRSEQIDRECGYSAMKCL